MPALLARSRCIIGLALALGAGPVIAAQTPHLDVNFAAATPGQPKLVIVRERYYGAQGFDLGPYITGLGNETHVQSIYFRFFESNNPNTVKSTVGRVAFHPSLQILGIVTDGSKLAALDAHFGLPSVPANQYAELHRGFDSSGEEYVCETSDSSFIFGLHVGEGVDDFRVFIRYPGPPPQGMYFNVSHYNVALFGGVPPSRGFIVGDPTGAGPVGSLDYGPVNRLAKIPLTSNTAPSMGCVLEYTPLQSTYAVRNNATTGACRVDAIDTVYKLPAPNVIDIAPMIAAGVTEGPDGRLYVVGAAVEKRTLDVMTSTIINSTPLPADRAGSNVDVSDRAGTRLLYVLRQASTAEVDVLDIDTNTFVGNPVVISQVGTPVGIADAAGKLYVLGREANFVELDPVTLATQLLPAVPTSTTIKNVDLCALSSDLFVLQRVQSTPQTAHSRILRCDPASGQSATLVLDQIPIGSPVGITVGPDGNLHLLGASGGYVVVDPSNAVLLYTMDFACNDFAGDNVGIAFPNTTPSSTSFCIPTLTSDGCLPTIYTSGIPSLSSSTAFRIDAANVSVQKQGILFFGPAQVPGAISGYCVAGPNIRTTAQNSGGGACDCQGAFAFNFTAWASNGTPPPLVTAGSTLYAQYWYRDPAVPSSTGFSSAVQFDLLP